MKKISVIISTLFFLFSVYLISVFAVAPECSSPMFSFVDGSPIYTIKTYPGLTPVVIDGRTYPNVQMVNYTIKVQNINNVPQVITLVPSTYIRYYVSKTTFTIPTNSTRNITLMAWIYGENAQGEMEVTGSCSGYPLLFQTFMKVEVVGKQLMTPPSLMPEITLDPVSPTTTTTTVPSGTTTTTTIPTTTTTIPPYTQTVLMNKFGCSFLDIKCPSDYSYCWYKFTGRVVPITVVNCFDSSRPNPGTLNSGEYLCGPNDISSYGTSINCTLVGYKTSGTTTTTIPTTTTSSTTTTIPTTTTSTSTTTTTIPPTNSIVWDTFGDSLFYGNSYACPPSGSNKYGNTPCPTKSDHCTLFYNCGNKNVDGTYTVVSSEYSVNVTAGQVASWRSCYPYKALECKLVSYSSSQPTTTTTIPTTTTSTTTPTSTTTTIPTTTTTVPSSGQTILMNQFGCSFLDIKCPSDYSYCWYKFTGRVVPITVVNCFDSSKPNPGTLNPGQSLCGPTDISSFGTSINCTLVGYK